MLTKLVINTGQVVVTGEMNPSVQGEQTARLTESKGIK